MLSGSTPCASCTVPTDNTIRLSTTSTSLSLTLTLGSPNQNSSNGFSISTYSATNYLVQSGTTVSWYPKCASTVCKDCNGATCISCYNNTAITLNTILKDGTCTTVCPTGYYMNGSTCYQCDANCKECTGTNTTCTACKNNTYLD